MNAARASGTLYVRHPDLVAADMDGETVMMSIERGEYFGIGGVGPRVWELLERPICLVDISAVICAEYEVDADTCRADIAAFVDQLVANRVALVVDADERPRTAA